MAKAEANYLAATERATALVERLLTDLNVSLGEEDMETIVQVCHPSPT